MARRLLQGERLQTLASSPHIWLQLPAKWDSDTFTAHARSRGVVVNAAHEFAVTDVHPRGIRLCVGDIAAAKAFCQGCPVGTKTTSSRLKRLAA